MFKVKICVGHKAVYKWQLPRVFFAIGPPYIIAKVLVVINNTPTFFHKKEKNKYKTLLK